MDITVIYTTFHPNTKEYIFLEPHRFFSKTDHIVTHKVSLKRYKII